MTKRIELYLSVSAVAISVVALLLSWYQLDVGRRHNQLSVRPLLLLTPHLEGPTGRNGLYLSNQGLGPAILRDIRVTVGEQSFEGLGKSKWREVLIALDSDPNCFALAWPQEQSALKIGEEIALLSPTKAGILSCGVATMVLLTQRRFTVDIQYESLYGDSHTLSASGQVNEAL
ncbi:MAG: hypothetical protein LCH73_17085 [Proteobacteria bacterium]|nr:hypothetical protein [Pseudomonadota bacterium]